MLKNLSVENNSVIKTYLMNKESNQGMLIIWFKHLQT